MSLLPVSDDLKVYENRLRFPGELEDFYKRDYNEKLMRVARPGTVLAVLTYLSFWILDIFALPENYRAIWLIRLAGIMLMSGLLIFTFTNVYKRFVVTVFILACLVMNLSVVIIFTFTHPGELVFNLYYITLFFVILGAPLLGLPFQQEIPVAVITLVAYLGAAIFFQNMAGDHGQRTTLIASLFFLAGASMIGIFGAYLATLSSRRDFLLRLAIDRELARSESLLLNVLPQPVAERLKNGEQVADYFDTASVLFADIVNFTPLSANLSSTELVALLNQVFSSFDDLVEKYKLEKIKTIGDCYMVTWRTNTLPGPC